MKKVIFALILAIMLIAVPTELFAVISGAPVQQMPMPVLLSSAGQGAGSKALLMLINTMLNRRITDPAKKYNVAENGDIWLEDETTHGERYAYIDSGYFKTLVLVISVTEKGLGASGITIEDEIGFLKNVLEKAKAQKMKIIAVSMETDARAPGIPTNGNERIIDLVCPQADYLVSIKANNTDDRFTKIGQQYNIPLTIIDSANVDMLSLLPQIFVK